MPPGFGDLTDAQPQCAVDGGHKTIAKRAAADLQCKANRSLIGTVAGLQIPDPFAQACQRRQHVLKHGYVEDEVGNQPLQSVIFFFELSHMFEFRRGNAVVFLAPGIKRGSGDTQLTADVQHGRAQFSLLQGEGNLLFGES